MEEKTITITASDARNLVLLISAKYDESLRYNPRRFISLTKGKAQSYYKLLEEYSNATRGDKK